MFFQLINNMTIHRTVMQTGLTASKAGVLAADLVEETLQDSVQETVTAVDELSTYFKEKLPGILNFGIRVLLALFLFWLGHKLISWIRKLVRASMERAGSDTGARQFVDSLAKYGLHIILLLIIGNWMGVESTSVAALVASAGVGISLALQGSLSNLAGGMLILTLKPFVVGDYIIEDTNKNEGTVKEIQIFYTKLATVDNRTIVIPNGTLANSSLTNVTDKDFRQLDLRVGISYESDLRLAKEILREILKNDSCVEQEMDHNVFVDNLADSCVSLGVRAWVKTEDYWPTRWRMLEEIKLIFDEKGIVIPYNQMTVHVKQS